MGLLYSVALVSLDLALLLSQQGRTGELKQLAAELMAVFSAQEVHREATAALVLFQRACEEDHAPRCHVLEEDHQPCAECCVLFSAQ